MEVRTSKIYEELPEIVIKRSSDLIGLAHEADAGSSKQQLRDFLEATVPSADKDEVTDEVSVCLCTSCITYTPPHKKARRRPHKSLYFGCFMRVTKSRCSEYVGTQGIVIRETKNTFMMICPNDQVKIIPKLHSEFSFVVGKVGFSVLGNHLHQRSAERAKHNFKKLSLWL
nr:uncharacterized protein LOC123770857 [Procambarus clarkii]